jgi:hypothetical protein
MSRTDLRWSLAVALLVAPAALQAQAPTGDSAATKSAKKGRDPAATAAVVCRDGTAGAGAQGCASHGGVDAVTTNAGRTGRVEPHPVETGQTDPRMSPSGQTGMPRDTGIRIKTDTSQPPGWGTPPDVRTDSAGTASDSTS